MNKIQKIQLVTDKNECPKTMSGKHEFKWERQPSEITCSNRSIGSFFNRDVEVEEERLIPHIQVCVHCEIIDDRKGTKYEKMHRKYRVSDFSLS